MILEESTACRVHDTFTIIHRKMATETDAVHVKKNSYSATSPDGSHYSRAAKSVLEESDDEEDEDAAGELSRNPSLVDDSFFHDEEGDRDDDEPADSINEQHFKKLNYCVSSGNPMCHGEFPMLSGCHLDFPMLPGCQGNTLAEQLDMMTQCRHPLGLFSVFQDNHSFSGEPSERLLPGMHFIPKSCEYCSAEDTALCTASCQRPKSFFFKKRPPLCPKDETFWGPTTEIAMKRPPIKPIESSTTEKRRSLLLRDFFR